MGNRDARVERGQWQSDWDSATLKTTARVRNNGLSFEMDKVMLKRTASRFCLLVKAIDAFGSLEDINQLAWMLSVTLAACRSITQAPRDYKDSQLIDNNDRSFFHLAFMVDRGGEEMAYELLRAWHRLNSLRSAKAFVILIVYDKFDVPVSAYCALVLLHRPSIWRMERITACHSTAAHLSYRMRPRLKMLWKISVESMQIIAGLLLRVVPGTE